ncbi:MAG: DUF541 domain-containing protein, partial [Sphingobacteriales bacterium]
MKMKIICALFVAAPLLAGAQGKTFVDQPYVEVSAIADTLVAPDQIYIKVRLTDGFVKKSANAEASYASFLGSLKAAGVDTDRDLLTGDVGSAGWAYVSKAKTVADNSHYYVRVKDPAMVSRVFLSLEKAGIEQASVAAIQHSATAAIRNRMRQRAVSTAKEKAVSLASAVGQRIGSAIHIA